MYMQYPIGQYAIEQPMWLNFYAANYSLLNFERTREGIVNRAYATISLPMPKEPQYSVEHEFGEGTNPVGPVLSAAGVANSGGLKNFDTLFDRLLQGRAFGQEYFNATSTFRRFSNVTEATMVSEARKKYFFDYIFVPKSHEESIQVENIVSTFRRSSYPTVASGLPERTYPQQLWAFTITPGYNASASMGYTDLTANWLGEPMPCVLHTILVKKNDKSDPIIRYLPNGNSNITLMSLVFVEFETGTYDPTVGRLLSKSEISTKYFGPSSPPATST